MKCQSNHEKLYILVVLRLWDYAQTIFRSGKLQISYAKAEIGPQKAESCAKKFRFFATSECTSECSSDYVREYISEYVSEYTSEYISEYISEKKQQPQQQPQQNRCGGQRRNNIDIGTKILMLQ